jgi:hypothetical protein
MKILIGCIYFQTLTGSEMYVYQLAKSLVQLKNYDVTVISNNIGYTMTELALKEGIKVVNFEKLDRSEKYDIIHCQHIQTTQELIGIFPNIPKICSIHSDFNGQEVPVIHPSIKKYIAIRPSIKDHLIHNHNISPEKIIVIFNPIDEKRFNTNNISFENFILFVGTIENLRKNAILDLTKHSKEQNKELWLIGRNYSDYLKDLLKYNKHVKHIDQIQNVEDYFKRCSETGGILLGRTTIEGWMCGKSGWIYNVDSFGSILNKEYHPPPDDLNKFSSSVVIMKIIEQYKNSLI